MQRQGNQSVRAGAVLVHGCRGSGPVAPPQAQHLEGGARGLPPAGAMPQVGTLGRALEGAAGTTGQPYLVQCLQIGHIPGGEACHLDPPMASWALPHSQTLRRPRGQEVSGEKGEDLVQGI